MHEPCGKKRGADGRRTTGAVCETGGSDDAGSGRSGGVARVERGKNCEQTLGRVYARGAGHGVENFYP